MTDSWQKSGTTWKSQGILCKLFLVREKKSGNFEFCVCKKKMNKNNKKGYFKEEWLDKDNFPAFLPWLVKGKVSTKAKCKFCQKTIELSNIGFKLFEVTKVAKKYSSFRQQLMLFQIFNNSSTVNPSECPDDSANIKSVQSSGQGLC